MRTNIVIDDALIAEAMEASGAVTKRAAVEQGLKLLVEHARRVRALNELSGIGWEGDLDAMRTDLPP